MIVRYARLAGGLATVALVAACSVNPPPATLTTLKYPDFPALTVPDGTRVSSDLSAEHQEAWRRLQSGDLDGARREFTDVVRRLPSFYPADAGLGLVALAGHDLKTAATRFNTVVTAHPSYLPALDGQAQTALAAGDDATAEQALEAIVRIDPSRPGARERLDVVKFRLVDSWIESARRAREAGRLDEAQATLTRALAASPSSAVIQRELALVDLARSQPASAEAHARKAVQIDAGDAESWALLGDALDRQEKYREAVDAYDKAVRIDPRPAWRDRRDALSGKADEAAEPAEFRAMAHAATVNRGDVAALIGLKLGDVLAHSGRHATVVATDVRGTWAETWIFEVLQAGVMDVFPNHTFQPAAVVRRGDLAQVVSSTLTIIASERATDLAKWKEAQPRFADVASTHLSYPAVSMAVASGVMSADGDRFGLTHPVTGADLTAAVARLHQIATR